MTSNGNRVVRTMPQVRNVLTIVSVLLLLIGITDAGAAAGDDLDRSRLVVKLAPTTGAPQKLSAGTTGRPSFDALVTGDGITELRQPISSLPATHHKAADALRNRLAEYVVIDVPVGRDADALKKQIEQLPDVEFVEYDVVVTITESQLTPSDPYFSSHQYPLRNTGIQPPADHGTAGADLSMEGAWDHTTGDTNVVLAIIDTGIDYDHPDLDSRIWYNTDEGTDGWDADSNGYISDFRGWNFYNHNNNIDDDHSHGSHCAGIAAAESDNGIGIAGMDWNCQIMVLKALGASGSGSATGVAAAMTYAVDNGADIVSMSLGSMSPSSVEQDAAEYAELNGVTIFAAMGNDDVGDPHYPAAFPEIIAVGGTDSDDNRAHPFCGSPGSNYGDYIDICAPGNWVWSTVPNGSYSYKCGTSMATPHAAGLGSLIKSLRPNYTPAEIRELMRAAADDQVGRVSEDTPGFDHYHGWGRINGRATLQALTTEFAPNLTVPGAQTVTELETLEFIVSAEDSNFTPVSLSSDTMANATFVDSGNGIGVFSVTPEITQQGVYDILFVASDGVDADSATVTITILDGCLCLHQADLDFSGVLDAVDLNALINVIFFNEPDIQDEGCPITRADLTCDGVADAVDLNYLIEHIFFNGPLPCDPCTL
ncbi:MAG: S8 family serine peptidase [candidate division Zixibacteria bacterium]|nr:S8 family serine peptidase [candidate division Zixibacteria bacterium]